MGKDYTEKETEENFKRTSEEYNKNTKEYEKLKKMCENRCDTISFWKKRCKREKCVGYQGFVGKIYNILVRINHTQYNMQDLAHNLIKYFMKNIGEFHKFMRKDRKTFFDFDRVARNVTSKTIQSTKEKIMKKFLETYQPKTHESYIPLVRNSPKSHMKSAIPKVSYKEKSGPGKMFDLIIPPFSDKVYEFTNSNSTTSEKSNTSLTQLDNTSVRQTLRDNHENSSIQDNNHENSPIQNFNPKYYYLNSEGELNKKTSGQRLRETRNKSGGKRYFGTRKSKK